MSAITIRQLPDGVKEQLRLRAAAHGRSMEAEARAILTEAVSERAPVDLGWIEALIAIGDEYNVGELPIPDLGPATAADLS